MLQEIIGIDPGLNSVTILAPTASRVDFNSKVILKFYYRVQVAWITMPATDFCNLIVFVVFYGSLF